jgi:glycosyltransferase involved in cell wall biosynthesis
LKVALIVTPLDIPGGGARQALKLSHELKALGHSPTLFTPAIDRGRCYPALLEGLDIRVPKVRALPRAVSRVGFRVNLDSLRRATMASLAHDIEAEFDVLNPHDQTANWPAAKAKARLDIPSVWMCNEPSFWHHQVDQRQPWQRRLAHAHLEALDPEGVFLRVVDIGAGRAMDRVVVLDRKNKARVRAIYGRESVVVRSGVDAQFFAGRNGELARREHGLEGAFVMLHVGYAAPWKGQADALRALKEVLPSLPRARLVLVGSAVRSTFEPLAASLGVRERVTFLEGVSDEALAGLYAACDVLVFPADQTWGLNVTEAMAAAKPTIVSSAAGVSEVLQDGKTAFVVPHGDVAAITKRVLELAGDGEKAREVGKAARAYVRSELTWRRYAENMVATFEDALGGSSTS